MATQSMKIKLPKREQIALREMMGIRTALDFFSSINVSFGNKSKMYFKFLREEDFWPRMRYPCSKTRVLVELIFLR